MNSKLQYVDLVPRPGIQPGLSAPLGAWSLISKVPKHWDYFLFFRNIFILFYNYFIFIYQNYFFYFSRISTEIGDQMKIMVELLLMWILAPWGIQARLHWDLCCRRAWKQETGALSSLLEGRRAGSLHRITTGVGQGLWRRRSALGGLPVHLVGLCTLLVLSTSEAAGICGLLYLTVHKNPNCACLKPFFSPI